ncbi:class I SAM-dependent methyltransferase [Peribacillus sp. SCS-26]|uniref:class I SAM-dependent methyltransferase n=1 Tax=Paraperibacillus marinus TaxID=3115295 RepID=UPI003905DB95
MNLHVYGQDLFKGSAAYYSKYRPLYPSSLVRFLVDKFNLNGEQKVLDLGCGPGHLSIRLSDWCHKIVGIDTEPEMIEEAKRLHQEIRMGQIHWFNGTLDQYYTEHKEQFRLAIIAKAFHWMNRAKILDDLYDMISAGGGVAIIDNYDPIQPLTIWQSKLNETLKSGMGKKEELVTLYTPIPL